MEDLVYPIWLAFLVIFELMFNVLLGHSATTKYSIILLLNFFFAIILTMYFLKKDADQNKYFKQRINNYWLYVFTQMLVMIVINLITAIISGIFTFLFSSSPAANGTMFLALITISWLGTSIVFVCRSLWTSHKYIATVSLIIIVFFALADSNNQVLHYINWILPPAANMVISFHERANTITLMPLIIRQFVYSIILFVISGLFNKKNFTK